MFDVLIRHATVIDGTRAPRFVADIGINGDRIDSIGVGIGGGESLGTEGKSRQSPEMLLCELKGEKQPQQRPSNEVLAIQALFVSEITK